MGKNFLNVDLFILGTGVLFPEQLTIETLDVLVGCKKIMTNLAPRAIEKLPDDLRSKVVSLSHLYIDGRNRLDNYYDVSNAVLDATDKDLPVAWLTPGHPTVFDRVTQILIEKARGKGLNTKVLSAISCIDSLLADLEFEAANGLFIYEATGLVTNKMEINPKNSIMLLQPSVFLSELAHLSNDSKRPGLAPLRDYLLQYFPKDHKCAFVRSYSEDGGESQIHWVNISEIPETSIKFIAGSTLWIPRLI